MPRRCASGNLDFCPIVSLQWPRSVRQLIGCGFRFFFSVGLDLVSVVAVAACVRDSPNAPRSRLQIPECSWAWLCSSMSRAMTRSVCTELSQCQPAASHYEVTAQAGGGGSCHWTPNQFPPTPTCTPGENRSSSSHAGLCTDNERTTAAASVGQAAIGAAGWKAEPRGPD